MEMDKVTVIFKETGTTMAIMPRASAELTVKENSEMFAIREGKGEALVAVYAALATANPLFDAVLVQMSNDVDREQRTEAQQKAFEEGRRKSLEDAAQEKPVVLLPVDEIPKPVLPKEKKMLYQPRRGVRAFKDERDKSPGRHLGDRPSDPACFVEHSDCDTYTRERAEIVLKCDGGIDLITLFGKDAFLKWITPEPAAGKRPTGQQHFHCRSVRVAREIADTLNGFGFSGAEEKILR
jgi:hypothetical protein